MVTLETTEQGTRQRVLEAAIGLLAERSLSDTLLEDAAAIAGCPLSRAQVFFRRDEDLVLALYLRLARELEARVPELPEGDLADRFRAAMLIKFGLVAPYREALASLLALLLDPRHELGAFSRQTELIRNRVMGVFAAVAAGATDRNTAEGPAQLRMLYGAHLALMLLWTQDRSPESVAANGALDLTCDLLSLSGQVGWLPNVQQMLAKIDGITTALVEPEPDPAHTELARTILRQLFRHRRLQPDAGACADDPCDQCFALHLPKVRRFVMAGEPIHLLLPAFPAKSPNPRKVLGRLPDLAEELALGFLDRVCAEIKELYPPGARITICSDGRVFSDLVGVTDDDVTAYGQEIDALIERIGARSLDTFNLEGLYEVEDHEAMRERLRLHYAESLETIEKRAEDYPHHRTLFNGIQRFLFEDSIASETGKSRTQIRNECKDRAYKVIQRSDAWGKLIDDCFPTALRLSIHPQIPHSDKIGILLGDADEVWLTPWHGVAVRQPTGGFTLMQRHRAEELGAEMVQRDGRPSHYQLGEAA
jgi:pyoverdine/dityrosine biosynthesis protein Dit1